MEKIIGRRGFIGAVAGAIGGFAFDPERIMWVPGLV